MIQPYCFNAVLLTLRDLQSYSEISNGFTEPTIFGTPYFLAIQSTLNNYIHPILDTKSSIGHTQLLKKHTSPSYIN